MPAAFSFLMLLTAFFVSGAAGLIYQICWIRAATLVIGSTTHAVGIVLATFFGGLAIGSAVFGRVAARSGGPIRIYALLELGIALFGGLSLVALGVADALLTRISRATNGDGVVLIAELLTLAAVFTPPAALTDSMNAFNSAALLNKRPPAFR